ncbi:hypothetical protein AC1031_008964 [Aphanomyces cochlioides]|nr:hypothetical protein AC1031_008964 [Aphanomyces cochlioides]
MSVVSNSCFFFIISFRFVFYTAVGSCACELLVVFLWQATDERCDSSRIVYAVHKWSSELLYHAIALEFALQVHFHVVKRAGQLLLRWPRLAKVVAFPLTATQIRDNSTRKHSSHLRCRIDKRMRILLDVWSTTTDVYLTYHNDEDASLDFGASARLDSSDASLNGSCSIENPFFTALLFFTQALC